MQPNLLKMSLEPVFEMRASFGAEIHVQNGPLCQRRAFMPVLGGSITGPRLNAEIVPGTGGDWPRLTEGSAVVDGQWVIRAGDGTLILMKHTGFLREGLGAHWRGESAEFAAPSLHLSPMFEAPDGPHDWLTWTVFIGKADRRRTDAHYKFYAVM